MNKLILILILIHSIIYHADSKADPDAQAKAEIQENIVKQTSSITSSNQPKLLVTQLEKFDPTPQISMLDGYNLRARKIIVPSLGEIAEHAHQTRPGIVYVESGEIIEYRAGNSRLLKAGDSLVEDFTTVHAYKNMSQQDCVLIAFDVPTQISE